LYSILSFGVIATFVGHGAFAVSGKDSFIELLTGSLDHVFGATMSVDTADTVVRFIGGADIALASVMTLMLVGVLLGRGRLHRFAYSNVAIGVYTWAVVWGFVTAFARMTAVGQIYPEFWDLVERGPNWMLPAGLVYLIMTTRKAHPEEPLFVPESFQSEQKPEPVG
jgi:hypothetical protein